MRTYHFTEAEELNAFIEGHKGKVIGCCVDQLFSESYFWPSHHTIWSDTPIVILFPDFYLKIIYLIPSDIEIIVGTKDEMADDEDIAYASRLSNNLTRRFQKKIGDDTNGSIENSLITDIQTERFSDEFEINTKGDVRPQGGDYFSTIRVILDSGKVLCFCGVDAEFDGYIEIRCESR